MNYEWILKHVKIFIYVLFWVTKDFRKNYGQTVSKAELNMLHNAFNWFSHVKPQNYYQSTLSEKLSI